MPIVLEVEGGHISDRDVKAAREVAEDFMTDQQIQRLSNRIADEARDENRELTRAARDRDRATPRDLSGVESDRLRKGIADPADFRSALSGRQRKIRSAQKHKVLAAAPASQRRALDSMLAEEDPEQWRRINYELHEAAGDTQQLAADDRATVQRLDRLMQSYERANDRTHTVYVAVELPDYYPDVKRSHQMPETLQPGMRIAFDQFTLARHNMHETPGHDGARHIVFELTTSRGMYLGRSDSIEDTRHLLPRGMQVEVAAVEHITYETRPQGHGSRIIVQLKEI